MSYYFEPSSVSLIAPPAVAGDLIVGRADGNFDRLPVGASGKFLSVVAGAVAWGEGPLTTLGDLLIGATGAAPTRLGIGATGSFLNVSGGAVRWGNTLDSGGLTVTTGNLSVPAGTFTLGSTLIMNAAPARLVPAGAAGFAVRDSTNAVDNLTVTDAGVVTTRSNLIVSGASITLGANPALASGSILIPNNSGGLTGRNAANTADIPLIDVDASNVVQVAAFGAPINLAGNATTAGFVSVGSTLRFVTAASQIIPGATSLSVRNNANTLDNLIITDAGAGTFRAGISHGSTTFLTTTVALTNNAGVAAGTLGNCPNAGNPIKWITINDNGTVRSIPTW